MYTLYTKNYRTFSIYSSDGTLIETVDTHQRVKRCLHGDTVILNPTTNCYEVIERAAYPLLAGRLELTSKTKYGMTKKGHPMYLFLPFRKEFPPFIVGCSEKKPTKNRLAVIEFENWLETAHLPRGSIQQMLGTCGDFQAEKKALLFAHSPWKYPTNISFLQDTVYTPILHKQNVPHYTFSIDPPGCCDVDDVISIEVKEDCTELWISIADVASIIKEHSTLDTYASKIGQTTYLDGKVMQPMLPLEYSHGHCSLLQSQSRPGLSLILTFREGLAIEKRWERTTILNLRQYTYDNFLEEGNLDGIPIDTLQKCISAIGCSDLEDIHAWVEVAMLTYNKEAAILLRTASAGVLRRHAGADAERWAAYEALKPGLGRLAEASAEYCFADDDDILHKGLCADVYCHASSPIRRYADLVNQRAIHAILDTLPIAKISWKDVYHMNRRQKDTKHYERDSAFLSCIQKSMETETKILTALVLDIQEVYPRDSFLDTWKISLWIDEWKCIVSWKTNDIYDIGKSLELSYFLDMENRFWKERIVFRACN